MVSITEIQEQHPLKAALSQTMPNSGAVFIWWLGQAGFALRYADWLIAIDLYLSDFLAKKYQDDPFPLFTLPQYLELVSEFLQRLRPDIRIQRLCGETHPRHLLGPHWGLRADAVQRRIEQYMKEKEMWQGKVVGGARRRDQG